MAFRITFFKTSKHRVFQYNPIYWDPEKEAREERLNPQKRTELKRGSFQKALHSNRRHVSGKANKFTRIIIIVAAAALLTALIYFTKFIEVVMQSLAQ
jgi:hypothetical protein